MEPGGQVSGTQNSVDGTGERQRLTGADLGF